jgi:hypothetical protein
MSRRDLGHREFHGESVTRLQQGASGDLVTLERLSCRQLHCHLAAGVPGAGDEFGHSCP